MKERKGKGRPFPTEKQALGDRQMHNITAHSPCVCCPSHHHVRSKQCNKHGASRLGYFPLVLSVLFCCCCLALHLFA
jgi:hypothetical protein